MCSVGHDRLRFRAPVMLAFRHPYVAPGLIVVVVIVDEPRPATCWQLASRIPFPRNTVIPTVVGGGTSHGLSFSLWKNRRLAHHL